MQPRGSFIPLTAIQFISYHLTLQHNTNFSHLFHSLSILVARSISITLPACMDREQMLRDIKVNASSPLSILNASKREKGKVKREDSLFTSKWMEAAGDCYWKRLSSLVQCMGSTWWNWPLSVTEIWLCRNSGFPLKALISLAVVICSYCGPLYHMDFISEHEAFQGNKKPQNPRQSERDCIMLIWRQAGTFGSYLTHEKEKSARIWANPLSSMLSLPLPTKRWTWARASRPPYWAKSSSLSTYFICEIQSTVMAS